MTSIWKVAAKPAYPKSKHWLTHILAKNRGLTTTQKLKDFLNPTLEQILSIELTNTQKAVARISQAIKNQEKIIVYSDYDADGICATAIMWETLHDLGADVLPYVPHRIKEGYGLSSDAIAKLAKKNVKLIITVDHGVTAHKQIEYAKSLKVDVIVTDHHVLPKIPPNPFALVHTTNLCGAGVAWCLSFEIVKKLKLSYKGSLIQKLELAALATIADLVPLVGANRAIVKIGLEKFSKSQRPGLKALIKASGLTSKVGTYEIGHILAPRINAMGRIEHGLDSLRLLCVRDYEKAQNLASLLSKTNNRRQDLTVKAVSDAMNMVDQSQLVGVLHHNEWHEGVIGLVASRLVESFHRPMIVISRGEVYSKGSARSIPGFNIVEAIHSTSKLLVDGGGHPMAAGFTIETRHIDTFAGKINEYATSRLTDELLTLVLKIDCQLTIQDITRQTFDEIKKFEPFGVGNPQPLFLTRNMLLEDVRTVGADNRHLKIQVNGLSAIGFNLGEKRTQIRPGYKIDLVYTLAEDNFNGAGAIQLKIKDLRISS